MTVSAVVSGQIFNLFYGNGSRHFFSSFPLEPLNVLRQRKTCNACLEGGSFSRGKCIIRQSYQLISRGDPVDQRVFFKKNFLLLSRPTTPRLNLTAENRKRKKKKKKKPCRLTYLAGRVYDDHSIITPEGSRECKLGLECYRNSYWITLAAAVLGLATALGTIHRHCRLAADRRDV